MWTSAGEAAPDAGGQVAVDLDGVLVIAHSETQDAAATWKKTFGHHPPPHPPPRPPLAMERCDHRGPGPARSPAEL
ncbi:hypothetical protein [Streptomyces sp. GbtcB6]|uniref:hypothetical protein n=1 Tax=Streptomyces sp. GbtcB6 TaxID=2824751 RepID=UPI002670D174|nr:hypothetical protein [Streptomyces sp. GbtcB6]